MTKVLIIDDEEAIRFAFNKFLTDRGCTVSLAADESEAMDMLKSIIFDVAVIDHVFSDSNGENYFLKKIRKLQPFCQVILMSGASSFKVEPEPLKTNAYASLAKPIRKDVICRMVAAAAEESKKKKSRRIPFQP